MWPSIPKKKTVTLTISTAVQTKADKMNFRKAAQSCAHFIKTNRKTISTMKSDTMILKSSFFKKLGFTIKRKSFSITINKIGVADDGSTLQIYRELIHYIQYFCSLYKNLAKIKVGLSIEKNIQLLTNARKLFKEFLMKHRYDTGSGGTAISDSDFPDVPTDEIMIFPEVPIEPIEIQHPTAATAIAIPILR